MPILLTQKRKPVTRMEVVRISTLTCESCGFAEEFDFKVGEDMLPSKWAHLTLQGININVKNHLLCPTCATEIMCSVGVE